MQEAIRTSKSKYDTYLKKVKARTNHTCLFCSKEIIPGDFYYRETNVDKFLQTLHAKKFCSECYEKYGEKLLRKKKSVHSKNTKSTQ